MDVRVFLVHTLIVMLKYFIIGIIFFSIQSFSSSEADIKKTHLEDIFIWKMSDELKLSVQEEKKFTEIHKNLNKQKAELNKKIQEATSALAENNLQTDKNIELNLKNLRKMISEYNKLSIDEFDAIKKLLGNKRFTHYLQIKSDLTNKVKSLLIGDKQDKDKKEMSTSPKLPPPEVIIEKNDP